MKYHTHPCTTCPFKEDDPSLCKTCAYQEDKDNKPNRIKITIIEVEY